jgi:hypothetical protein
VFFTRSGFDFADAGTPIADYYVWRRIDDSLAARVQIEGEPIAREKLRLALPSRGDAGSVPRATEGQDLCVYDGRVFVVPGSHRSDGFPPGTWEVVGSAPPVQQDDYIVCVPTVSDSTTAGVEWTVLCVTAHTATPSVWYASPPDSGYSLDNIAPEVPGGFAVEYHAPGGNELSWDACPDEDFQYFRIYRYDSEDFEPSPENLVHMTIDVSWLDPDGTGWDYYKITALDHVGNESDPASPETVTGVDPTGAPTRYALHQNVPNPLNPTTVIRYDVPSGGGSVTLDIFDVSGRRVRRLVDGHEAPGRRSVVWDGKDERGGSVASGVYYCRLVAPGYEKTLKMMVAK